MSVAVAGQHSGTFRDIFIDGFVPPSSSFAPMFPFYENNPEWDDFGEIINPDDYVIKEEDMDQGSLQVSTPIIMFTLSAYLISLLYF